MHRTITTNQTLLFQQKTKSSAWNLDYFPNKLSSLLPHTGVSFEENKAQFSLGLEWKPKKNQSCANSTFDPKLLQRDFSTLHFPGLSFSFPAAVSCQGLRPNKQEEKFFAASLLHLCLPSFSQLLETTPNLLPLSNKLLNMWNCKKTPKNVALSPLQSQGSQSLADCSWNWQPKQTKELSRKVCSDEKLNWEK